MKKYIKIRGVEENMKPFIPYKIESLYHAEDTLKIMEYLKRQGVVTVTPHTIERLYEKFSGDRYSAYWMDIDTKIQVYKKYEEKSILDEFIEWLEEIDI